MYQVIQQISVHFNSRSFYDHRHCGRMTCNWELFPPRLSTDQYFRWLFSHRVWRLIFLFKLVVRDVDCWAMSIPWLLPLWRHIWHLRFSILAWNCRGDVVLGVIRTVWWGILRKIWFWPNLKVICNKRLISNIGLTVFVKTINTVLRSLLQG